MTGKNCLKIETVDFNWVYYGYVALVPVFLFGDRNGLSSSTGRAGRKFSEDDGDYVQVSLTKWIMRIPSRTPDRKSPSQKSGWWEGIGYHGHTKKRHFLWSCVWHRDSSITVFKASRSILLLLYLIFSRS